MHLADTFIQRHLHLQCNTVTEFGVTQGLSHTNEQNNIQHFHY